MGLRCWAAISALLGGIVLLCAGCNGGDVTIANVPATTTLRALLPGDRWTYAVTGSATLDGAAAQPGAGTATITLSALPFQGVPTLAELTTVTLTLDTGPSVTWTRLRFLRQDPISEDVVLLGVTENGFTRTATQPPLLVPGAWHLSLTANGFTPFAEGGAGAVNLVVTDTVSIQVPAGVFGAWVTQLATTTPFTSTDLTAWVAPEIGEPVRFTGRLTTTAPPVTLHITADLQSFTLL